MKKLGFTLAEILITLGIIGVVAALTTPALVKNTGNAKTGPALAKFVNTFETGVQDMFYGEELSKLELKDGAIDITELPKYIIMSPTSDEHKYTDGAGKNEYSFKSHTYKYTEAVPSYNPEGKYITSHNKEREAQRNDNPWKLKDGTYISFVQVEDTTPFDNSSSFSRPVGVMLVDINGKQGPNKAGSDVFAFIIDEKGILIPAGGADHKTISNYRGAESSGVLYGPDCDKRSEDLKANFACTGKIADNNWKAEY